MMIPFSVKLFSYHRIIYSGNNLIDDAILVLPKDINLDSIKDLGVISENRPIICSMGRGVEIPIIKEEEKGPDDYNDFLEFHISLINSKKIIEKKLRYRSALFFTKDGKVVGIDRDGKILLDWIIGELENTNPQYLPQFENLRRELGIIRKTKI